ncbi:MAG: ribosomal protein S18-alanine N-acetyltransferase [Acidimicrobiia bacterium]|nr:ribosomal protein S18-alanine N-acetyltransferase [Acidimicrobiia bacterium]
MIEPVTVCDEALAKDLEEIELTIFGTAWPNKTIRQKINTNEFKYWVYKKDQKIIAYLGIQFINDFIEVLGIGVIENYRKNGFANELMNELVNYFNNSSYNKILLEVRESNNKAKNLYANYGFKQISKRKNYYKNEDADIYLKEKIYV